jgi:hypothetical protein
MSLSNDSACRDFIPLYRDRSQDADGISILTCRSVSAGLEGFSFFLNGQLLRLNLIYRKRSRIFRL